MSPTHPFILLGVCAENELFSWFEHVSPSGVLKPDTDPVDGIFSGQNTDDFVGPDNADWVGKNEKNCDHVKLAVEAHHQPWAVDFCGNSRASSGHLVDKIRANGSVDPRAIQHGPTPEARMARTTHLQTPALPLKRPPRKGHVDGGTLRPDLPPCRTAQYAHRMGTYR